MEKTDLQQKLGKRIREIRLKSHLSQDRLAELATISNKYLGEIERGTVNVSVQILEKIAAALNVDMKTFFNYDHHSERRKLEGEIVKYVHNSTDDELILIYRMFLSVFC